ncbi:GNAT family N-acetyltransferase [Sulfobacillus harzensis]|uniref:GNAT family N-acetyltransferase n=1 Tax=Sulfobacillus harzensis TaxID=2729629 RepID=A0A7Y0Q228_9FIRM|nr:GNAT family N-acetyltransferase [Sulfobacillus harzensis]NMP21950.1 GNAT family N-acetyltransferase [Sulfobacillus harzensis]
MVEVTVRQAVLRDAPSICRVHQSSVRVLCQGDYTPQQIEAWIGACMPQDYRDSMADGEHLWVAEADGQVVGFAGRRGEEITAVYVDPHYAHQRIWQRLLQVVERSFLADGTPRAWLDASLTAVSFYAHQGYQSSETRMHRLRSGMEIECVRMEKPLIG